MPAHLILSLLILLNGYTHGYLLPSNSIPQYNSSFTLKILNNRFGAENPLDVESEYDFIIVGSGSAGSVIATRLSEVSEWKILLLEAGERASSFNQVPISAPVYQVIGGYNWNYTMEKQDGFCLAMEDQLCSWPRGKALGGTTVLNYMIYTRGHPNDYDRWGKEYPGWSYQDVLPYFMKSENCNLGAQCESSYHGTDGLLSVEQPYFSELTDHFIAAGQELGYKEIDYIGEDIIGFSKMQATQKFGRRHNVATAFLDPVWHRQNLKIVEKARVTKILINPDTRTAYGVEFARNGYVQSVRTRKETIVSAGALNSPQLLLLSGIGPKDHLNEIGISPIIQDLPVGEELYDHIAFAGMIFLINKPIEPPSKLYDPLSALNWLLRGKGFWTSLGGIEAIAYLSTTNNSYPDIELLLNGIGTLQFDRGAFSRPQLRIAREVYDEYFKPLEGKWVFSILPVLLHPKSVGCLKLRSKNPDDPPLCFGNYLSDADNEDLNLLIKSIRLMQQIVQSSGFQELDATLYDKPIPGCENFIFDTDNYWECAIRHLGVTVHHQISTCKMGKVVDNKLRVHGVRNLRVADTSVIPIALSAHTNAPAIMVGEKTADIIKIDYEID